MKGIEVEHVEAANDRAVDQHRPDPFLAPERGQQADDAHGRIPPVDPDAREPDRLDALGRGDDDGGDRGETVAAIEGAVVYPDDPRVRLAERPPQR